MGKEVYRTEFAKKLKKLREEQGLTTKQVAEAVGIKHDAYRWYETKRTPRKEGLVKIAAFFNVSVDYLIGKEESSNDVYAPAESESSAERLAVRNKDPYDPIKNDLGNLSETEILAVKIIRSLNEEDRRDVLKYLSNKGNEE